MRIVSSRLLAVGLIAAALLGGGRASAGVMVSLELSLAVDVSGSISAADFQLQRQGYVNAFRDPNIQALIAASPGGIAANLVYWASPNQQQQAVGWTHIQSAADANAFADAIAAAARPFNGGTSISGAMQFARPLFASNNFDGARMVLDISGDGENTSNPPGTTLAAERTATLNAGIVINGLVIGNNALLTYYQNNVIGGSGSFALRAATFDDFELAVTQKIAAEISSVPEPSTVILVAAGALGLFGFARRRSRP